MGTIHLVRTERFILEQAGVASGLLTEEQLDHAWHVLVEALPAADLSLEEITDDQLAKQLVDLEYLNEWQAEQLRQGRTKFNLGSYQILDAIGRGGMGWVFKGTHKLLGRVEAIKVLPKNKTNPTSIECFHREIRAQARLDHPNLVRLSYADLDGDTYFLVTEYIEGIDLRRIVHGNGPLTQEMAAVIVSEAASALDYVHREGLIHRDVKPGNLLITHQGRTKLADLGLAIFADEDNVSKKKVRHIVGTADFLAPEIIVNPSDVRPINDIYSLGCTLYYAVTGKVPYPSGDTADKLRRQLDETPIPPHRLNSSIDLDFCEMISLMMQKRPEDRIQSAAEVVAALQPWATRELPEIFKAIGSLTKVDGERHYVEATLADTVVSHYVQAETPSPPKSWNEVSSSNGNSPAVKQEADPQTLDHVTKILVGLGVLVAIAAVFMVMLGG